MWKNYKSPDLAILMKTIVQMSLCQQNGIFVHVNTPQNVIHLIDKLMKYGVIAGMWELLIIFARMIQRLVKPKWKS